MPSLQLIATGKGSRYETMIATCPPAISKNRIAPPDLSSICFTAGTSEDPKGVVTSHGAAANAARATAAAMGIGAEDVLLTTVPLAGAGCGIVLPSLMSGAALVVSPLEDVGGLLEAIRRYRVTQVLMTRSHIIDLLDRPGLDRSALGSVQKITCCGGWVPASVLEEAIRRFGPIFQQAYGMTEAFAPLTLLRPEEHVRSGGEPASREVLRSAGHFVPGVEHRIIDEEARCLDANSIGEVVISSPALFSGYWRRPALTERLLVNGWLRTGDLGYVDQAGRLHIVDKLLDVIESSGRPIYPHIVEEAVHEHATVKEACLAKGEAGSTVLFVSLRQAWQNRDDAPSLEREILDFLRTRVEPWQMPGHVQIVKELPRGPLGKVLRRELTGGSSKAPLAVAS